MKCFYHPNVDAVGICSQCGKYCCRNCIEDIGKALLCKDCMSMAVKEVKVERKDEINKAKRRITWSWIIAGILSILFVSILASSTSAKESASWGWGRVMSSYCVFPLSGPSTT